VKDDIETSGLYYKPMTIVNDDSRVITKLETSLTDDARVVIYDHHMFIVQAGNTKGGSITVPLTSCLTGLESAVWLLTIFVFICKTD